MFVLYFRGMRLVREKRKKISYNFSYLCCLAHDLQVVPNERGLVYKPN